MRHRAAAFHSRLPGRLALLLVMATSLFSVSACGFKGPLVLPPGPRPTPLFGNTPPAPAKPAAKPATPPAVTNTTDNDTSTDKNTARP